MHIVQGFSNFLTPSKEDWLNVPSVWTPLRRNSTHGLRVYKSPSSLISFYFPSYISANDCCFPCVLFYIPVLPFPSAFPSFSRTSRFFPHFPSQNPVENARSRSLLQGTISFYIPIPFSPMYFLSLLYFLIQYFPSFPYFPYSSRTFSPKILLSMPAPNLSSSILPSLFLYPSLLYFPVIWILLWLVDFNSIASVISFSSPFVLLGFSWKMYLNLSICFLYIRFLFIHGHIKKNEFLAWD